MGAGRTPTSSGRRRLPRMDAQLAEVVEQDEFTLDLVVRLPDGLFLVYDTT